MNADALLSSSTCVLTIVQVCLIVTITKDRRCVACWTFASTQFHACRTFLTVSLQLRGGPLSRLDSCRGIVHFRPLRLSEESDMTAPSSVRVRPFSGERRLPLLIGGMALLALVVTTAALTARAFAADRIARESASRSLSHLASFASWELSRHLAARLESAARIATSPAARLNGRVSTTSVSLEPLLPRAVVQSCECPNQIGVSGYVTAHLGQARRLTFTGARWEGGDTGRVNAIIDGLRRAQPELTDSTQGISPHEGLAINVLESSSGRRFLITQPVHTTGGQWVAVFAALVTEASVDSFFRSNVATASLLPESITERVPRDSLLKISVATRDGESLFETAAVADPTVYNASEPLGAIAPGLAAEVRFLQPAVGVLAPLTTVSGNALLLFLLTLLLSAAIAWTFMRQARLDALRSDFMAGVSHQFHTPLALISAYAETSASGKARDDVERGRFLNLITREAQRLSHLVDNVMHVSATGRSTLPPSHQLIPLSTLVAASCTEFGMLAAAHQCVIITNEMPSVMVSGDESALRSALFNVLDNAVRYGGNGRPIHVGLERHGAVVDVIVADEGPGIAERDRVRAFARYERLTSALGSAASAGTGIGLSIVRDVMTAHGGSAWIESAPGGGTRVRLRLPVNEGNRS
jgi:signal transduction histidine kinase